MSLLHLEHMKFILKFEDTKNEKGDRVILTQKATHYCNQSRSSANLNDVLVYEVICFLMGVKKMTQYHGLVKKTKQ